MLDCFLVTGTPFDELHKMHGPEWDRAKYAECISRSSAGTATGRTWRRSRG